MSELRIGLLSLLALLGLMLSTPVLAQGHCDLEIDSDVSTWRLIYDPLQEQGALKTFQIYVRNNGNTPCNLKANLESLSGDFRLLHEGSSQTLAYSLIDEGNNRNLANVGNPNAGSHTIQLSKNDSGQMGFTFAVNPSVSPAAGLYVQHVEISLVDATGRVIRKKSLNLEVQVVSGALIGLKGQFQRSGSTAYIDLGDLVEGPKPLLTTLYVQSTAGYIVSVESAHRGRLRQGNTAWMIPYSLMLGQRSIDLNGIQQIEVISTRPRFDDYPLTIDIGSTAGRRAGEYRDTLTFTVAAI
jgi:spore coat protein U-like protein